MSVETRQTPTAFLPSSLCFDYPRRGRIFVDPVFAHIRYSYDDERLDNSGADEALGRLVDAPFHAGKRSCGVENVLSVVQIQHGITFSRKSTISRREIHQNIASVAENSGPKCPVRFDISGQRVFAHRTETLR